MYLHGGFDEKCSTRIFTSLAAAGASFLYCVLFNFVAIFMLQFNSYREFSGSGSNADGFWIGIEGRT